MPNFANYRVVQENPNTGQGCLCKPDGKAEGCDGPFVTFPKGFGGDPRMNTPVVGVECLRAAVSELPEVSSGPAPLKANVVWEGLSKEDQLWLQEENPNGGLARVNSVAVVEVPASQSVQKAPEVETLEDLLPADTEVPGTKPGTYERVSVEIDASEDLEI